MGEPSVAVVVPVYGKLPLTIRFLEAFAGVTYPNYRIIIVDDNSPDGTGRHLAGHYPHVTVLRGNGGLWWAGATNKGVRHALRQGFRYVLTINNDSCVHPSFLSHLVETAEANPSSIVGSRIHFLDQPQKVWAAGGFTDWGGSKFFVRLQGHDTRAEDLLARQDSPVQVELLTGCGTLVPADCYRRVGLYAAHLFPQYHADSELALRAGRHGYRILVDLRALVWNDVANTCLAKHILHKRSPYFWLPLLAMHLRYCPWRFLAPSLLGVYGETVIDQLYPPPPGNPDRAFVRVQKRLGRLLRRAA
jgi:GT2 family glycosyltransferase